MQIKNSKRKTCQYFFQTLRLRYIYIFNILKKKLAIFSAHFITMASFGKDLKVNCVIFNAKTFFVQESGLQIIP